MSWWKHFETEVPALAELGVTQVWLPPPNKAMVPVCCRHPVSERNSWFRGRKVKDMMLMTL